MLKFTKIRNPDNSFDQTEVEMDVHHECLPEIFQAFKGFLQACGFTIEGDIDVVEEDEITEEGENDCTLYQGYAYDDRLLITNEHFDLNFLPFKEGSYRVVVYKVDGGQMV